MTSKAIKSVWLVIGVAVVAVCWGVIRRHHHGSGNVSTERVTVLATFLPVYVFTLNVVGDAPGVEVGLMLSTDLGCPHEYAVRPADLMKLAEADVVIANGLGMEPFLDELLKTRPDLPVLTISDDCDVISSCGGHDHDAEHDGHEHDHHSTVNGHAWLSPAQAAKQVRTLARKLAEVDGIRAQIYRENANGYAARLEALQGEMAAVAQHFARRNMVTPHDAFAYLARDLDLTVVATLESEPGQVPSAARMQELIEIIRKENAVVFSEPSSSDRAARTIARDAGVRVWELDPFNSREGTPSRNSYEEAARKNLEVLSSALGNPP